MRTIMIHQAETVAGNDKDRIRLFIIYHPEDYSGSETIRFGNVTGYLPIFKDHYPVTVSSKVQLSIRILAH